MKKLKSYEVVIWDFDGVIKESLDIKKQAFLKLFKLDGGDLAEKIATHHENNGGLSRYLKIPLYLEWAGIKPNPLIVADFCERYSKLVLQNVVDSQWVPGVKQYLDKYCNYQNFFLVTATPQDEIEIILDKLKIRSIFHQVYGAPSAKITSVRKILGNTAAFPSTTVMVGDSEVDLRAANENGIDFILRKTMTNISIQSSYEGLQIMDFSHESD